MTLLLHLPTESLDEIARRLSRRQLLALCLVSRRMNAISTRFLYRRIILSRPSQTIICCKTLIVNNLAAQAVRNFQALCCIEFCSVAFYHVLVSTLQRLSNITKLTLEFGDSTPWNSLWALERCTFPNLRLLQLSSARVGPTLAFLQSVRSIRTLRLHFCTLLDPIPSVMGPFPHLVEYTGSGTYLSNLVPGSRLESVLFRIYDNTDVDSAIKSLSGSAHIDRVNIISDHLDPRVFQLLAVHARYISTLRYESMDEDDDDKAFLAVIQPLFGAFKHLKRLEIYYPGVLDDVDFSEVDLRDDHDFVQRIAKLCPCLILCTTPSAIRWRRIHVSVWIPVWTHPCTRQWVSGSDMAEVRSRLWLEPLVEDLCEEYNLENPLKDSDFRDGSVVTESDDSEDYEPVPPQVEEDEDFTTDSEASLADDEDSENEARPHAISFLEHLWYARSR